MSSSDSSNGSAVYNILAFAFQGQNTAAQILDEIKESGILEGYDIVAQATVDQDANGKVKVHQPGKGGKGAAIGGVIGGALGLIGGPAGVVAMAAVGAAIGGTAGHFDRVIPQDDLEELGTELTPDTSALLLLLEDTYSESVVDSMSGYDANVVTLTVGSDLSGQIAQYKEGSVSDAEGDVVAGESVVAADAEGDVVAAGAEGAAVADDGDGDSDAASDDSSAAASGSSS